MLRHCLPGGKPPSWDGSSVREDGAHTIVVASMSNCFSHSVLRARDQVRRWHRESLAGPDGAKCSMVRAGGYAMRVDHE